VATDNFWGKFRRWRRHRPFWGGLLLVLSALELFISGNMNLNGIELHLGPQGFLSYLLPLLLLICGMLSWFSPAQRLFYGVVSLLAALYTFIGLNLGGFFVGMLLGIFGGSLVIAWGPPRIKPDDEQTGEPPAGGPSLGQDQPGTSGAQPYGTQHDMEIAGHDDRPGPIRPATRDVETTAILPGFGAPEEPRGGGLGRAGKNPKTFVVGLIALTVTASFLVAGSRMPASAEDCPPGLPFRSASASVGAPASSSGGAVVAGGDGKVAAATPTKAADKSAAPAGSASTSAAAPAAADKKDDDLGKSIADGFQDFVDGVGNLLGISDDKSPSPSGSPTPSESSSAAPEPAKSSTSAEPPKSPAASSAAAPAASASGSASGQPSPSNSDDVPCLGARQLGKVASADDIPPVPVKPGLMEVDSLTMYDSTYDGVVTLTNKAGGTSKALKFSMNKAVNKPFSLTIDEPGNAQTVITSKELVTEGRVRFYTPEFKGKLFGLIPVTFTPEHPPPLTLPILWFTDVTIKLAYVRCDVLTADPMTLREKS